MKSQIWLSTRSVLAGACLLMSVAMLGACDDSDNDGSCTDGATRSFVCGADPIGHQSQTCVNGFWYSTELCTDPSGDRHPDDTFDSGNGPCVEGATRADACGENDQGLRPERCEGGDWVPTNECSYFTPGGDGDGNGNGGDGVPDKDGCATYDPIPSSISEALTLDGCYKAEKNVNVRANLAIAPGSVLLFAEGTGMKVGKDGSLNAVGTSGSRILIAGERSIAGFWKGITFSDSDRIDNRLSYVTVQDGGKDGGSAVSVERFVSKSKVVIDHTTIENSAGFGLFAANSALLPDFSNNTFTRNKLGPADVYPQVLGYLDADSDYSGNEIDVIRVHGGTNQDDVTWSGINVPYEVHGTLTLSGVVTISDGAIFQFVESTGLFIGKSGTLIAVGTDALGIVFEGSDGDTWNGIEFSDSDQPGNQMSYVTIKAANKDYGATAAAIGLSRFVAGSQLGIDSVTFELESGVAAIHLDRTSSLSSCENPAIDSSQIVGAGADDAIAECGL